MIMPKDKSVAAPETKPVWQGDGGYLLPGGKVLTAEETAAIVNDLVARKMVVMLRQGDDPLTQFHGGIHTLTVAFDDAMSGTVRVPVLLDGLRGTLRGLLDGLKLGMPYMIPVGKKTPGLKGLVAGGRSGVGVLTKFEANAYNASLKVDTGQLDDDSGKLELHQGIGDLCVHFGDRLKTGIAYYAERVFQGATEVYGSIKAILPIDEGLAAEAQGMVDYFEIPVQKGQATKKVVTKTKKATTAQVTQAVGQQAKAQAVQTVRAEMQDKLGGLISDLESVKK